MTVHRLFYGVPSLVEAARGSGGFDLCDDLGVWVVVPRPGGRWSTAGEAQTEADRRNHEGGVANPSGVLYETATDALDEKFEKHHLTHPECTCKK